MLPDHGELWSAVWTTSVYDGPDGTTLAGSATGTSFPYEFHRRVTLDPVKPVVRFHYALRHTGDEAFPWIWSSHPLLNVQPGSVLSLSGVTQAKVAAVHGRDDWEEDDVINWPGALTGETGAFTFPSNGRWAAKLFADLGESGQATLTDPRNGEQLEFRVDPSKVPQVGIWINCSGWAPAPFTPYYNLALEPCIGAPDRLDLAALEWNTAQTLKPGEERQWSIEVRLPEATES
jgi:galactose mutarotase-like enzyme